MQRILVASGNSKKLAELRSLCADLPIEILSPADLSGELPDVIEDADTFAGNAAKKALEFAVVAKEQLGNDVWALADDSGLCVDFLDGAPGVHSARFAELYQDSATHSEGSESAQTSKNNAEVSVIGNGDSLDSIDPQTGSPDGANNALLLKRLIDTEDEQRGAAFHCCICVAHGSKILLTVEGSVRGQILREAQGKDGFGYDPLFFHQSSGVSFAELSASQKAAVSHRGQAVGELRKVLKSLLGSPSNTAR